MNVTRRIPWAGGVFIVCVVALSAAIGCADRGTAMATDASDASGAQGAQTAASASGAVAAEAPNAVQATYEKREYRIVMRDGVALHTAVYSPRDMSRPYPILMRRTPYSCRPYGEREYPSTLGDNPDLMKDGYIYVFQDVRGCYMSEGEFVNMRPHLSAKHSPKDIDESTDTYDTIDWLIRNVPNNNGRVGMWGISYPGFYCAAGMIDAHPALKAVSPQAPIADWWYDDFHHHGAFLLAPAFPFMAAFGRPREGPNQRRWERFEFPTPDGYAFYMGMGPLSNANEKYLHGGIPFWNDMAAHPDYDTFWQARNIVPHLNRVSPAVMTVGGWYDAEDLYGPLKIYESVESKNPGIFNVLVMGPWVHGGWARTKGDRLGNIEFGAATSDFYREQLEDAFFRHFLKGDVSIDIPEASVFETGVNQWRSFDAWPPSRLAKKSLYLAADGGLTFDAPGATAPDACDTFVSDPARPVPYTEAIVTGMTTEFMTDDQRFAARRPDVLVYQTQPLTAPLTIAGPVVADLWVSTSQSDADWVVKLIDVLPPETPTSGDIGSRDWPRDRALGDYQRLVRADVFRGRYRNDRARPEPFSPGEPAEVRFEMPDVLHTFQPGHRVMVQIQSTWFPLVDRNPQRYVPNIFEAKNSDFVSANHRVFRNTTRQSRLEVGVLAE
ncbi:MAG TPA: CocE/NonD family hydrolase [Phycisphaerae bacterium]|nr:CocE/NonD family hydrolase [Phycisphaerae bacterium]HRW51404.1 CocE/NonD family hydrolase [Phycisphaerae bacterium]